MNPVGSQLAHNGVMEATFGELMHRWRDRRAPADVGLPAAKGRRAPGLRREELAALAGLSVDYVIRLEHGRATRPSAQVVRSVARALQLSRAERDELFVAAGLLPPRDDTVSWHIPAGVQRLLARIPDFPVAVFAADWTLLEWNSVWSALLGDPASVPVAERNLALAMFGTGIAHQYLHPSESESAQRFERSIVADLRHAAARYPNDTNLTALVERLLADSKYFARLWADSTPEPHASATKTIVHPVVGPVTLDCDVLSVPGADLHVVAYTAAAGSEDEGKLSLLRVAGAEFTTRS